MAGTIIKKVDGKRYLYFEYFEDGKTVQKYCGPEGSESGRLKALELEYEYVRGKRDAFNERLGRIEAEMKKIGRVEGAAKSRNR